MSRSAGVNARARTRSVMKSIGIAPFTSPLDACIARCGRAPIRTSSHITTRTRRRRRNCSLWGEFPTDQNLRAPELAALTMVANQIFSLDEALNKRGESERSVFFEQEDRSSGGAAGFRCQASSSRRRRAREETNENARRLGLFGSCICRLILPARRPRCGRRTRREVTSLPISWSLVCISGVAMNPLEQAIIRPRCL
jgi:hypothetical protein